MLHSVSHFASRGFAQRLSTHRPSLASHEDTDDSGGSEVNERQAASHCSQKKCNIYPSSIYRETTEPEPPCEKLSSLGERGLPLQGPHNPSTLSYVFEQFEGCILSSHSHASAESCLRRSSERVATATSNASIDPDYQASRTPRSRPDNFARTLSKVWLTPPGTNVLYGCQTVLRRETASDAFGRFGRLMGSGRRSSQFAAKFPS